MTPAPWARLFSRTTLGACSPDVGFRGAGTRLRPRPRRGAAGPPLETRRCAARSLYPGPLPPGSEVTPAARPGPASQHLAALPRASHPPPPPPLQARAPSLAPAARGAARNPPPVTHSPGHLAAFHALRPSRGTRHSPARRPLSGARAGRGGGGRGLRPRQVRAPRRAPPPRSSLRAGSGPGCAESEGEVVVTPAPSRPRQARRAAGGGLPASVARGGGNRARGGSLLRAESRSAGPLGRWTCGAAVRGALRVEPGGRWSGGWAASEDLAAVRAALGVPVKGRGKAQPPVHCVGKGAA